MQDADLEAAIIKHGVQGQWQKIAALMAKHGKSDTDCLFRFRNYLRKKLNNNRGGLRPKGKTNFNDHGTMTDLLVEGYGVVTVNRAEEATFNTNKNQVVLHTRNDDKFADDVIMISTPVALQMRKYVPNAIIPIIDCLNVYKQGYGHFWWRAISVTYFLRPNEATLALLDLHSDPVLKQADGKCVSAFVRHGDKAIEMSLVPFQQYGDAANCLWHANDDNTSASCATIKAASARSKNKPRLTGWDSAKDEKILYLGSEDPQVFSQAKEWAAVHNINLRYSNLSQLLLSDKQSIMRHRDMEARMPANRQLEYFSYLLHLSDLIRCRAMICTLASNFCRVADELRATVGGKASNAFFVDLSTETCPQPPCARSFSISDYQGVVYDPADRLWR